ncbi:hypothetical protein HanOQP8_Chr02g0047251 [Helianthus annuus]|nr:hypothetical protein HanOQP8_Chr02g0047251 [Helianthus annuus]
MCYVAAQMATILYRMHRPKECKSLILSPQTLLNLSCQYVDRLRVFLTQSEYGIYDIEAQPFYYLRVKKPASLAKSDKPDLIKDLAIYRTKEIILKVLISNFREGGPQYPMLGTCNMHGLVFLVVWSACSPLVNAKK